MLASVTLLLVVASTLPVVVTLCGINSFELLGPFGDVGFHKRSPAAANLYQLMWVVALVRGVALT